MLLNNHQLNDTKRFCASDNAISIIAIHPTVQTSHFLPKENVYPVMFGPIIIHTRKEYQSYFSLPRKILQLELKLAGMGVLGVI